MNIYECIICAKNVVGYLYKIKKYIFMTLDSGNDDRISQPKIAKY